MHVDTEGGDVTAKFYMNIKEIQKWRHFRTVRNGNIRCYGCSFRLDMIRAQIDAENDEIEQLKQENEKMQKRIEVCRRTLNPTEAEAENAHRGIIDRQKTRSSPMRTMIRKREEEIAGWKREVEYRGTDPRDETKGGSILIVFVGAEDRGYWVRETAQIRGEELEFVESSMTIQGADQ